MRRRQLFEARELALMEEEKEMKVPNSNMISNTSPAGDKEKYKMFEPNPANIVKPNGTPYRKAGSKTTKGK